MKLAEKFSPLQVFVLQFVQQTKACIQLVCQDTSSLLLTVRDR